MPRIVSVLCTLVVLLAGCGSGGDAGTPSAETASLRVEVLATLPHDPSLFTQGLEIARGLSYDGYVLYEGTGLRGRSLVRATALKPGTRPGRVLAQVRLPDALFGEGITVVGGRIWQLTWTSGVAIERDRRSFEAVRRVRYAGEGWGLCFDGRRLVASDGSARLTFRDPDTFERTGSVRVIHRGQPQRRLNELECVDGAVWANVWKTERIVRIDPHTGRVTAVVDATGLAELLSPEQRDDAGVLNGIAAIPGTEQFLITGKNWPAMFRVRFVPRSGDGGG